MRNRGCVWLFGQWRSAELPLFLFSLSFNLLIELFLEFLLYCSRFKGGECTDNCIRPMGEGSRGKRCIRLVIVADANPRASQGPIYHLSGWVWEDWRWYIPINYSRYIADLSWLPKVLVSHFIILGVCLALGSFGIFALAWDTRSTIVESASKNKWRKACPDLS